MEPKFISYDISNLNEEQKLGLYKSLLEKANKNPKNTVNTPLSESAINDIVDMKRLAENFPDVVERIAKMKRKEVCLWNLM